MQQSKAVNWEQLNWSNISLFQFSISVSQNQTLSPVTFPFKICVNLLRKDSQSIVVTQWILANAVACRYADYSEKFLMGFLSLPWKITDTASFLMLSSSIFTVIQMFDVTGPQFEPLAAFSNKLLAKEDKIKKTVHSMESRVQWFVGLGVWGPEVEYNNYCPLRCDAM